MSFGTLKSKLWKVLDAGHYDVKLTREEMRRVKCWIDLNVPLWPDYIERSKRPSPATQMTRIRQDGPGPQPNEISTSGAHLGPAPVTGTSRK